jgi:hypothetical protein
MFASPSSASGTAVAEPVASSLVDLVARVGAELAGLMVADVRAEADDALRVALEELARASSQLAGAVARITGEFDARKVWAADGARSAQAWLRHRAGMAPDEAGRQVRRARHLRSLPVTLDALCAGEITTAHVQRIVSADTPRTAATLRHDEAAIVAWARTERYDRFCARLAGWVDGNDPDGGFRERPDRRRLHLSRTFQDGYVLDGWVDPVGGGIVAAELDRLERELFHADWRAARERRGGPPDVWELARTPAQRRADALVEMARRSAAMAPGAQRGRILLTVVSGPERFHRMCELLDGTLVGPDEVARHVDADVVVEHIVFSGDEQPIAASKQRTFTGVLRRAIRIRDRECTESLCDETAERCQVDHIVPWSQGGPTTITNGRLRCGPDNRRRNRPPPADT